MCRMWRFIWSSWNPETAHAHPQGRKATQMHTMRLCICTLKRSQKTHQNTFLGKAKSMQMVRFLFDHRIKSNQTSPHPQWREATSLQRVWDLIQPSRTPENPPPRSHWRKTVQVHTLQFLKCSILSSQTTHDQTLNNS